MLVTRIMTTGPVDALRTWQQAAAGDPRLRLFRYEDLTGENQFPAWQQLLAHCDIRLPDESLRAVLKEHSFKVLTTGRERGVEDVTAHYRKGIVGDWKNHFTPAVEQMFRETTGSLVEELGYSW